MLDNSTRYMLNVRQFTGYMLIHNSLDICSDNSLDRHMLPHRGCTGYMLKCLTIHYIYGDNSLDTCLTIH